MTSLSAARRIATSSLGATQVKVSLTAHNIANADTKGFVAKRATQSALVTAGLGSGVVVEKIFSNVSKYLLEDLMSATTKSSAATTRVQYLDSLQKSFGSVKGKAEGSTSLSSTIVRLEKALTTLAGTPESKSLASAAVSSLQDVTRQMQTLHGKVQDKIDLANKQVNKSVSTANEAIEEIHQLNRQIKLSAAQGQSSAELEDKLNAALGKLSEQLDIKAFRAADGSMKVFTTSGQVLVDRTAHNLSVTNSPSGRSKIAINGADITGSLNNGKLGALIKLRDKTLPAYKDTLNKLAGQLITQLNSKRPGLLTGTGAGDIRVNAAVLSKPAQLLSPGIPAKVANALLDALQKDTAFGAAGGLADGNMTFTEYANEILSKLISETNSEKSRLNLATTELSTVTNTISSMHGVNLNEETARLAELKQLYSVASTVLSTIQEMFKDLRSAVS